MRSRGLVVAIAIVLGVAAAAAVVLYTQGIKQDSFGEGGATTVIVSTQDIPASTQLQPLVDQGVFQEVQVPQDSLVANAVTTTDELVGATTTQQIFANEQIPVSRLSTSPEPLNRLGISEGHIAVSVEIDAPPGGLGNIQAGDYVQVFATFQGATVLPGSLQKYISSPTVSTQPQKQLPPFTLTLIPTVKVLKIQNPPIDVETGRTDATRIQVTFDLLPEDGQNLVYAQENAHIWLGLLHPDEEGTQLGATSIPPELLKAKKG